MRRQGVFPCWGSGLKYKKCIRPIFYDSVFTLPCKWTKAPNQLPTKNITGMSLTGWKVSAFVSAKRLMQKRQKFQCR